jgi:hypothetical protein
MPDEEHHPKGSTSGMSVVDHETSEWKQSERKLANKLDMTLMPMVWILYMFNYLDRNNIASVSISLAPAFLFPQLNMG